MYEKNVVTTIVGRFHIRVGAVLSLVAAARGGDANYSVVTTDRLKALLDEEQELVLVDARTPEEFQEAHIKGLSASLRRGLKRSFRCSRLTGTP